ncbi:MAG: 3-hydroxyacyl-CoA dehydrogenase family protein [bacterium]
METPDWLETVQVIGAGTMGRGIAQVFLELGAEVTLVEPDQSARDEARDDIEHGLKKNEREVGLTRLSLEPKQPENRTFDLSIEAVPERLPLKHHVLTEAESRTDELLASNTSSIPLSDLSEPLEKPDRLVGLHFMNPAPVMGLVELVYHAGTPEELLDRSQQLINAMEKHPVKVKDSPGFVSNRLLMAMINRAISMVERDIADPEGIDRIMEDGMGHAMGPLRVADFIGLDVCLETMEIINERVDDDSCEPASLLQQKVVQGNLGQKTGKGFYEYD